MFQLHSLRHSACSLLSPMGVSVSSFCLLPFSAIFLRHVSFLLWPFRNILVPGPPAPSEQAGPCHISLFPPILPMQLLHNTHGTALIPAPKDPASISKHCSIHKGEKEIHSRMMIQMMIQLIQSNPILILIHRLRLRTNRMVLFHETSPESSKHLHYSQFIL